MGSSADKSFRDFLVIWMGQLISSIGSGLTAFALGIYVFQLTHSAASYSLVLFFSFLPSFLLRPLAGTLSDRVDRRLLMIIGDLGSAVGLLFILMMMYTGNGGLWVIYTGAAISSVFSALLNPAYNASVTDLLEANAYTRASGLMQLADSSKVIVSPIIAGILLSFWKVENILILDISTFIIASFAVLKIKKRIQQGKVKETGGGFFTDFKNGFRYTFSNKGLIRLLWLISLITFSVGFLEALLSPMILAFTDVKTLGIMQTIMASGMIVSSMLIGMFSKTKKHVIRISISLAFAGVFYGLLGVSTNIYFLVITGFIFFLLIPFIHTSLDVLIRQNVDNQIQGRVWSIVALISQTGMVIALGTAGILADYIFNPLFKNGGIFVNNIGRIIGAGEGRGIGLMFLLAGVFLIVVAVIIFKDRILKSLEIKE